MSDVSTLVTYRDAALAAIASADYATAKTAAEQALVMLSTMANSRKESAGLEWDREGIQAVINLCNRRRAAAGGIQRSKITYARASD